MHIQYIARYISLFALISTTVVFSAPLPKGNNDKDWGKDKGSKTSSAAGGESTSSTTSGASFEADSSINVASILSAVKAATSSPVSGGKFGTGKGTQAQIYEMKPLGQEGVYAVEADMDVDCDGTDYQCKGNGDGQKQTSYGALSAKRVPFYVLPQTFVDKHKIKGNSLGAVICNGKMYYAIMGDTNGDSPEVIGEASWLLAQTCFPSDKLDGAAGHDKTDVMYITFGSLVPSGISEKSPTIDIGALKELGDKTMKAFNLKAY